MSHEHHREARDKLEKLSNDVTAIRSESVDLAAGLESVTEFAGKMNDNFAAGFESLESKITAMDKKLDIVGRAVNTMDRRLIAAKDDINEINFRVGEIRENNSALRADHKSLLGKYDVLIEQQEVESDRRADLSAYMKSIQKEYKVIQDNQTILMAQISELVALLHTGGERPRLEYQKLREDNSATSAAQQDLTNTLLSILEKLEANESRIDQIFNVM
jgi:chromosome segregation ATPase